MKSKTRNGWMVWLLALLAVACDGETGGMTREAQLIFRMELPPELEVNTRASTKPSLGGISIENVWVVQYNATTAAFIKAQHFSGDGTMGLNNTILEINTQGARFTNATSRFYVIVNAGDDFLKDFSDTEAELKKKQVDMPNSTTSELKLLTAGPIEYTPKDDGKVIVVAPLTRAYSKISVKWEDGDEQGEFAINGMDIYNLPKKMALYTRGGGELNSNYPAKEDIKAEAVSVGSMPSGTFYDFYMPENLRGMGTAPSFADKGLKKYGPEGSLESCTYIVLKGTYTYKNYSSDGETASGSSAPIDVEYHIYLGGSLTKDYNIQRGYWYKLILNLSGANTGDVRVRITNGKTVVFDEVEEIEHKIIIG